MHKALQEQIIRHFGDLDKTPAECGDLLRSISDAYEHFDEDRKQFDRLREISSREKVAEQSRDEFFSIASHELLTPLTAIQGNASMLVDYYAEKMTDADMRQMIDDILHSSKRLIQIVGDFLDASRLEQHRMQFHDEEFDITKLVGKTIEEVNDLAAAKHLTISLKEILVPFTPIYADPSRTKQILLNLLRNAVYYTNEGTIIVGIQRVPNALKIIVEDTGVGIAEDQQAVLFRKFQQVGSKIHSRDVMSTGLGLYISKMIAEAMGGTVQLERSELGKGSVFSVTLPTKEKDSSAISS